MERNLRKTRVGIVTSDKMDKTVVVSIKDRVKLRFTRRSLTAPSSSRLMMRTTLAESATVSSSWRPARCPRTRDGA